MDLENSEVIYSQIINKVNTITDLLVSRTTANEKIGLSNGETGKLIYFYKLAHYSKNVVHKEYADNMIGYVIDTVKSTKSIDFENGLAGVGWGIEYLIQNNYYTANEKIESILTSIDCQIFYSTTYRFIDKIGLLKGILGHGIYLLSRVTNPNSNDELLSFLTNKQILKNLVEEMDIMTKHNHGFLIESDLFNLKWDLPVLIGFLAHIHCSDIDKEKVESIVNRIFLSLNGLIEKLDNVTLLFDCLEFMKFNINFNNFQLLRNWKLLDEKKVLIKQEKVDNLSDVEIIENIWVYVVISTLINRKIRQKVAAKLINRVLNLDFIHFKQNSTSLNIEGCEQELETTSKLAGLGLILLDYVSN